MKELNNALLVIIFLAVLFSPCAYAQSRDNESRQPDNRDESVYNFERDRCFLLIEKSIEQGKYQAVQKILDDFRKKYPEQNERKYYFYYAAVNESAGEYLKAEGNYIKAIDIFPAYSEAMNSLGSLYLKTGKFKESEEQLLKALRLNPYSPFINFNTGCLYYETGRFDIAEKFFSKACELKMNYGDAYSRLGMIMLGRKAYSKAIENFNKALEFDYLPFETHYYLGLAYYGAGRIDPAIANIEKSISIHNNFLKGIMELGRIYQNSMNFQNAIKYYQMAEAIDFEDMNIRISIAECYYDMKRYDDAADVLENLKIKDPADKRIENLLQALRDNKIK